MARKVKEWIGKTDDAMPPPTVRQRIYEREQAECYLCGGEIQPGQGFDLDHKKALKDGGENREMNLFPVHRKCHRIKTAQEAMERAPIERKKQKNSGAMRSKQKIKSRGFQRKERNPKAPLPPKPLFVENPNDRA